MKRILPHPCALALACLAVALAGCFTVSTPALSPHPQEYDVRAAIADIALSLAQSDFVRPLPPCGLTAFQTRPLNRADTLLLSEHGETIPFALDEFAASLTRMLSSPEQFQAAMRDLQDNHPQAWRRLHELRGADPTAASLPSLRQPLFSSVTRWQDAQCRVSVSLSCRYETESHDHNSQTHFLTFEARVVSLESGLEFAHHLVRIDRAWKRP